MRHVQEGACAEESLRRGLESHFTAAQIKALRQASIGIAGAGGLGSNVAMLLARCGIERMTIIDDDVVEPSNLNRQHYWPSQVGQRKVDALQRHLLALNGQIDAVLLPLRLTQANLPGILARCPIWVEALDGAETKSMFVEAALLAGRFTVAASGMCGFGGAPMRVRRMGNLVVVGDFRTAACAAPPLAPRVTQAAALMADIVIEHVLAPE